MSMKLIINGRTYDGQQQPFIGDMRLLKPRFGIGYGTVLERMKKMSELGDSLTLFDDEQFLDALVAYIWMARLRAGERDVTPEQIESEVSIDSFQMVDDDAGAQEPSDGDQPDGVAAGPTSAPRGSDPDVEPGADGAGELTPSSTTTSTPQSPAD